MRSVALVLGLAAALLLLVFLSPGPGPAGVVRADHTGEVVCPEDPPPVHDGAIRPGEYSENFFDPTTKVIVYFDCMANMDRTMHVALVSPWSEWTELRIQAAEAWNGDMNVVRTTMSGQSAAVSDGFLNGTTAQYVDDVSAGGTNDVRDPVGNRSGDAIVYEFGLPLLSRDTYDCQLTGNGSFYFQLAYVMTGGPMPQESSIVASDPHVIRIGTGTMSGSDTSVEISLPKGTPPGSPSEILVGLRNDTNRPLPSLPVSVFAQTAFGFLELGTAYTNEQGVAAVEYATLGAGEFLIGAAFAGGSNRLASVAWMRLVVPPAVGDASALPRGLLVLQSIIVIVLGGVWLTYGYAFFVVRSAMREPRRPRDATKGGAGP